MKQIDARSPGGKPRFAGEYIDLGNYATFVSHDCQTEGLVLGVTVEDVMPADLLRQLLPGVKLPSRKRDLHPYSIQCDVDIGRLSGVRQASESEKDELELEFETQLGSQTADTYIRRIDYVVSHSGRTLLSWDVRASRDRRGKVRYDVRLPEFVFSKTPYGVVGPAELWEGTDRREFPCVLYGLHVTNILVPTPAAFAKGKGKSEEMRVPFPYVLEAIQRDLSRGLGRTRYIAPLRAAAKRYYIASFDASDVSDPSGEQVPFVLRDRAEQPVENKRIANKAKSEPFQDALDYWLRYLRTGEASPPGEPIHEFEVSSREDILVQLSIRNIAGSESHALSDSGFGYSQVLPIIAKILLGRPGTTFVVEQPELHLNPALQVRLAQFLVAMSSTGRQLLIETHSEHLVNAVRVLAAEDLTGAVSRETQLYYLGTVDGQTTVQGLDVLHDGTVPEWPLEFFGESLELGSRLLAAQARWISKKSSQ